MIFVFLWFISLYMIISRSIHIFLYFRIFYSEHIPIGKIQSSHIYLVGKGEWDGFTALCRAVEWGFVCPLTPGGQTICWGAF